ncbi:MAG: Flp pilus assembly complex ATPase component TadA [Kiritimatiellae bacterium]|nr:Flp pilus assembly complex ATPase component TadA [Kiritimatiellia bacterium]
MVLLTILRPDGNREELLLEDGEYIAGRWESCDFTLDGPEVSGSHALVAVSGDDVKVRDMGSANGTLLNGREISGEAAVGRGDLIEIGKFILRFSPDEGAAAQNGPAAGGQENARAADAGAPEAKEPDRGERPDVDAAEMSLRRSVQEQIQQELLKRMDLKKLTLSGVDQAGLEKTAREKIGQIVAEVKRNGRLPPGIDPARLEKDVFNEAMRLGPLEDLLADDSVNEIMVNGPHKVYVERKGRLELSSCQFTDDASVIAAIERIVSPLGRRIDESQPYVDARLQDGSRVNAIIAPLSLSGPTITIRKFAKSAMTVEDFVRFGTWTRNAAEFMKLCVLLRKNIVVAGGTGSGKTTLLNLLSGFVPEGERIITVEDAAELKLQQPHVIRLEARPPNIEGKGAVTIRDLVKNCLRMRPDRIIVGECRGGEALDMLQAMNTGHDGSLTTVHANSPRDVISRLETMVMMSGMELPSRAIREQIASAVDIIIHETRFADGTRKVVSITEVTGLEGSQIVMQELFAFTPTGVDSNGRVAGRFAPTGAVPTWFDTLRGRGLSLDARIFDPDWTGTVKIRRVG